MCPDCKGPKLGHKYREEVCKTRIDKGEEKVLDEKETDQIKKRLMNVHKEFFLMKLAMLDNRRSKVICDECDFEAKNRYELECHSRDYHNRDNKYSNSIMPGELEIKIPGLPEILTKLTEKLGKEEKPQERMNLVTKSKPPPIWAGQSYERYKVEVQYWGGCNRDSEYVKYSDLIESLKKNDRVSKYVTSVVMDKTVNDESKTVASILSILNEKFAKTKVEKCLLMMQKILQFSVEKDDTAETYWDRFESLTNDLKKEEMEKHIVYVLGSLMIKRASESSLITSDEKNKLQDSIEDSKLRVPLSDDEVMSQLKFEYHQLRIEGKREVKEK